MFSIFIYPDNLKAKPKLWLWELRDVGVIGAGLLLSVKGLGRNRAWRDLVEANKNQTALCWMFPEDDLPCNCHDGG